MVISFCFFLLFYSLANYPLPLLSQFNNLPPPPTLMRTILLVVASTLDMYVGMKSEHHQCSFAYRTFTYRLDVNEYNLLGL